MVLCLFCSCVLSVCVVWYAFRVLAFVWCVFVCGVCVRFACVLCFVCVLCVVCCVLGVIGFGGLFVQSNAKHCYMCLWFCCVF